MVDLLLTVPIYEIGTRYMRRGNWPRLYRYSSSSADKKDQPIPFLNSPAEHRKFLDNYYEDPVNLKRQQRYAFLVGFGLFAFIVYMGFFRGYSKSDKDTFNRLTQDITERYPEAQDKLGHVGTPSDPAPSGTK